MLQHLRVLLLRAEKDHFGVLLHPDAVACGPVEQVPSYATLVGAVGVGDHEVPRRSCIPNAVAPVAGQAPQQRGDVGARSERKVLSGQGAVAVPVTRTPSRDSGR